MPRKQKKAVDTKPVTTEQPKIETVLTRPQFAHRFRVKYNTGRKHYDDALCRQTKSVEYSLLNQTITIELYETDQGTTAHAINEFMRSKGHLQLEGLSGFSYDAEPTHKLYPTGLALTEHTTRLDYAITDVQMHTLKFSFISLDLI